MIQKEKVHILDELQGGLFIEIMTTTTNQNIPRIAVKVIGEQEIDVEISRLIEGTATMMIFEMEQEGAAAAIEGEE